MMAQTDPRIASGIVLFNARDFAEAADLFEELVLECVLDELNLARVFLQVSTGVYHIECGQARPAIERLEEGLLAIDRVQDDRGYDLGRLRESVLELVDAVKERRKVQWPRVETRLPIR